MDLKKFIDTPAEWLNNTGAHADIVISTRVRLARNIIGIPFTNCAKEPELNKVIAEVKEAVKNNSYLTNAVMIDLSQVNNLIKQFLVERHLISRELAENKKGVVLVSDKEMINIMVNEEDHLRIQTFSSGLEPVRTWQMINHVDNELSKFLKYAYSSNWGYLTACPTNVGTGMRTSMMIHLPALDITKQIRKILHAISQVGLAIRGLYGEGTEALGDFFQISNQVTLGRSEQEITENIERITNQIIGHEQKAREVLMKENRVQLEDQIMRAYATLTYARIISSKEALELLSLVRLGVGMGLIKDVSLKIINELLVISQPAHVQLLAGEVLSRPARDVKRAIIIQQKLLRS
ncbi:MAG: protein arginine kinase [Nitrospirota bacterium]